jgi:hypothetical protein
MYPESVLLVLLDGSTARGEDTEFSDLDMRVVTTRPIRNGSLRFDPVIRFIYEDCLIVLEFTTQKEVSALIRNPSPEWPIRIWGYLEPTIVSSPTNIGSEALEEFRDSMGELKEDDFVNGIRTSLSQTYDNLCKIRTGVIKRLPCLVYGGARHMVWDMSMFVALINRRYYRHGDCRILEEAAAFKKLPDGFIAGCKILYDSKSSQLIALQAQNLWTNCLALAKTEGITLQKVNRIDEIPQLFTPQG